MAAKTASVGIRIDPALKKAMEEAAAKDRRSVASYIEKLIADDLERRGIAITNNNHND